MTTTRAAKYIALVDLGKIIQVRDRVTGDWHTGTFSGIEAAKHDDAYILVTVAFKNRGAVTCDVLYDDEISLCGQPSPHSDDPHGINTRRDQ